MLSINPILVTHSAKSTFKSCPKKKPLNPSQYLSMLCHVGLHVDFSSTKDVMGCSPM